jgi:hypothetical protein
MGTVDRRIRFDDHRPDGADPFDGAEEGEGPDDAILGLRSSPLFCRSMDRLEVDDDLRLDFEDETGEGKTIEVHEFEFSIERDAGFDIIDGVHLEVGPTG